MDRSRGILQTVCAGVISATLAACSSVNVPADGAPDVAGDLAGDVGSDTGDLADVAGDLVGDVGGDAGSVDAPGDDARDAMVAASDASDAASTSDGAADACAGLVPIGTGTSGRYWTRVTGTVTVIWNGSAMESGIDATQYVPIWNALYPMNMEPWPGTSGLTTQVPISRDSYLAEAFTVPIDATSTTARWSQTGSGNCSTATISVSICPGDFGQTGTQLGPHCLASPASASGVRVHVNDTTGVYCNVAPGGTYYLNVLPEATPPVGDVTTSNCPLMQSRPWLIVYPN